MIVVSLVLAVLALLAPTTIAALLAATFILVCIGMGLRGPTKPPE